MLVVQEVGALISLYLKTSYAHATRSSLEREWGDALLTDAHGPSENARIFNFAEFHSLARPRSGFCLFFFPRPCRAVRDW